MLPYRGRAAGLDAATASAVAMGCLSLVAALGDVTQDEDRRDRQDRHHEQGHAGAEGNVTTLNAEPEGPGGKHVRAVDWAACGQDAHDVEVGEGDDEGKERRDGDDVAHHWQCHVPDA